MTFTHMLIATAGMFAIVIAQPVFGFYAIPSYFNYSTASAIMLGLLDGALLCLPIVVWILFGIHD